MPNLNRVMLMGNLTRDPEIRVTQRGSPVANFTIAINREWKSESGEKQAEVTYVDIEAWGKTADLISKYFSKGKPIYAEGRLKLETWEDKATQQKRSRMKVVLESFQFIGGRDDAPTTPAPPPVPRERQQSMPVASGSDNLDEDIPF